MEFSLDQLLEVLDNEEMRLGFLKQIYTPGNTEVADKLLALELDRGILCSEINHSRETNNEDRFVKLGRRLIDEYVQINVGSLLSDIVIQWDNQGLGNYAIAKLSKPPKDHDWSFLTAAAEIAKHFGRDMKKQKICLKLCWNVNCNPDTNSHLHKQPLILNWEDLMMPLTNC